MNTFQRNTLAAAMLLAVTSITPVYAAGVCLLDDGAGGTTTDGATASGANATACGAGAQANGNGSVATGANTQATGNASTAVGGWFDSDGDTVVDAFEVTSASAASTSAFGSGARATDANASTFGAYSNASGLNSSAFGAFSDASFANSVAIGFNSLTDRVNSVSVGRSGSERQITFVAGGTADTDAVNVFQLQTLTSALGGGASFGGGVFTAPTYVIQGANYNNVGAAFAAVDGRLTGLSNQIAAIPAGPQGPAGPTGPTGPTRPDRPDWPAGSNRHR